MKKTNKALNWFAHRVELSVNGRAIAKFFATGLMLVACCFGAVSTQAQTVLIKAGQQIVTVPLNYNGTVIITNLFTIGTNGVVPDSTGTNFPVGDIDLSAAGIPSTPSGLTFSITDPNSNVLSVIPGKTNTSGFKTNIWLAVNIASVPEGIYTFGLNATGGATNTLLFTLQVGYIWNGSTNAVANGAGSWTDPSQWLGGGVPGPADDVIFSQLGAQTNSISSITTNIVTGVSTNYTTNYIVNCAINSNVTIDSLRFSQTNSVNKYHTIQIGSGDVLTITGTNGFSFLRDYINSIAAITSGMNVSVLGTNSSLIVSNSSANFSMLNDNQNAYLFDMSQLGNFQATVNRFSPGDYSTYPNFWNLDANGYAGAPLKFTCALSLAKTNFITASFVDPFNYTNPYSRLYAVSIWNTAYGSGDSQAGQTLLLGATNVFYADAVNFCGYGHSTGAVKFNPAFTSNNPVAIFRGTNGGRMSIFSILDCAGTNIANGNSKAAGIDFGSSHGSANILADRFFIARDRPVISGGSGNATYQGGTVDFGGNSIVDVNTAIIGDQDAGGHTNSNDFAGYCNATLAVSNNALFRVNGTLALGYTTETNTAFADSHNGYGKIIVGPGGTVIASNITVGGITKFSTGNAITINSNATLIVSNTIADTVSALGMLTLGGSGTLELFVDGNHSGPYVYTTNLTTSTTAGANTIAIGGIQNLTYVSGAAVVPLISFSAGGTPSIPNVTLPPGVPGSAAIVPNGSTEWDLFITTNSIKTNLLWRAQADSTGSANWDTTTQNWLDRDTGLMTNFNYGDYVAFDDAPGYATNVNEAISIILPGQFTITNTVLQYDFLGSGLRGGAVLTKTGSGTLRVDGSVFLATSINQGSLLNNGTVGAVTLSGGTTLNNFGTISGNLNCAGTATLVGGGTLSGSLNILNGGVVTNLGSINANGNMSIQSGGFLYNTTSGVIDNFGAGTLATNATLINDGTLGNGSLSSLTVSGTLEDTGLGSMEMTALTVASGGVLIPGGNGIGTSTLYQAGLGSVTFPGQLAMSQGSTNIFNVNIGTSQNTEMLSQYTSFGGSASIQTQNGCTIVIQNIGSVPFAAGQSFKFFGNSAGGNINNTGTSTNTFPIISPSSPGSGLSWDLSHLWVPNGSNQNGVIGVMSTPNVSLTNTVARISTNIVVSLSWNTNQLGWSLETQVNPLSIGLSTNWTRIAGSTTNTQMMLTNTLTPNAVFYRLVYP